MTRAAGHHRAPRHRHQTRDRPRPSPAPELGRPARSRAPARGQPGERHPAPAGLPGGAIRGVLRRQPRRLRLAGCKPADSSGAARHPRRGAGRAHPGGQGCRAGGGAWRRRAGSRAGRWPSRARLPGATRRAEAQAAAAGPRRGRSGPRLPPPPPPPSSSGGSSRVVAQAEEPDQPQHQQAHVEHAEADHEDPALGAHTPMLPRRRGRGNRGVAPGSGTGQGGRVPPTLVRAAGAPGRVGGCPARRWPCSTRRAVK